MEDNTQSFYKKWKIKFIGNKMQSFFSISVDSDVWLIMM